MSDTRKKFAWKLLVAMLIAMPLVYILSSGPMHGMAFHRAEIVGINPDGSAILGGEEGWWTTAYRPLVWVSEQRWGKLIARYWRLFPIVQVKE